MTEQTLVQRVATGDDDAVQECLDRFGGLVWSIAKKMTSSLTDAEDAVQEVFIDLWANAGRYDPSVASETTFVAMIARRRIIDRWRKKKREPRLEALGEVNAPAAEAEADTVETDDEAARIKRALAELKPEQQNVIRLSVYEGMTHREIAQELQLPLGTVKTHVRRGLIRVRELLGFPGESRSRGVPS